MSSTRDEILKACKNGELSRVRENYKFISGSASKDDTLNAMILTAAENDRPDIVQFCLSEGAEASYEVFIEAYDFPKIAQVLITAGAMDVNHDFEAAGDLLVNAICGRNYDYVQWLLLHGADPNSGHLMTNTFSALAASADRGLLDIVKLLVHHGTRVSGQGALAAATGNGHVEVVNYLIEQGADIDEVGVRDFGDRRRTAQEGAPLHQAATRGDVAMAKILVQKGAKTDTRDRLGKTPLRRAKEERQDEVIEYLEFIGALDQGGGDDSTA